MRHARIQEVCPVRLRGSVVAAIAGVVLFCAASVQAQEWAEKMFNKTTHDFGTVVRGAKVEYHFVVENIYEEDAHIKSIESSCGCTKPHLTKRLLKTWEKTDVVVEVDTRREPGRKDATIEVKFDQPFEATVQLHTHSYVRGDIVVQPGIVQFGSVNQGTEATRDLKVTYAGRSDWRIERIECANPHVEASFVETARSPELIAYKVSVKLKADAPPGYVQQPLVLVTNDYDTRSARVPVSVEGLVAAALTVKPSSLMMGVTEAGKPVTSNLVVQGRAPFRILAIHSSDPRFQAKPPTESKTFHIVPVTFLADGARPLPETSTRSSASRPIFPAAVPLWSMRRLRSLRKSKPGGVPPFSTYWRPGIFGYGESLSSATGSLGMSQILENHTGSSRKVTNVPVCCRQKTFDTLASA